MSQGWIDLFRHAISQEAPRPIILALATIDAHRNPQVRSIVCRRLDDSGAIWMTSDSRSAKIGELTAHPQAAASCWVASTDQQFRFSGTVEICTDESERESLWIALKPETRATFFWPVPGSLRAVDAPFIKTSDDPLPPDTFSVLVLRPASVELLELKLVPHRRRRWTAASRWLAQDLNP